MTFQNEFIEASEVTIENKETAIINLQTEISENDAKIAELEKRPTIEQIQDSRAGSIVLKSDIESGQVTLTLAIEQSNNLQEWTRTGEELTKTIDMPEGKSFFRFALDK